MHHGVENRTSKELHVSFSLLKQNISCTHCVALFSLGTTSAGPPDEYIARLDVEIDSARQGWKDRTVLSLT